MDSEFKRMQRLAGINESSDLKQLELTERGEMMLNYINNDVENDKPENYHISSQDEQTLMDLGMWIDGLYGDNKFTNLDVFALDIASQEYQDAQLGAKKIINKINQSINKGWVKIVPYKNNSNDDDKFWLDREDSDVTA